MDEYVDAVLDQSHKFAASIFEFMDGDEEVRMTATPAVILGLCQVIAAFSVSVPDGESLIVDLGGVINEIAENMRDSGHFQQVSVN